MRSILLVEAMEHLLACGDIPGEPRTAPYLLVIAGAGGPVRKLAALRDGIFVPRAELAFCPRGTGAPGAADPRPADAAARHARLARWIRTG